MKSKNIKFLLINFLVLLLICTTVHAYGTIVTLKATYKKTGAGGSVELSSKDASISLYNSPNCTGSVLSTNAITISTPCLTSSGGETYTNYQSVGSNVLVQGTVYSIEYSFTNGGGSGGGISCEGGTYLQDCGTNCIAVYASTSACSGIAHCSSTYYYLNGGAFDVCVPFTA
jgi:hypothetical protein